MKRVGIYLVTQGIGVWIQSCKPCLGERKDEGWEVQDARPAPHDELACDGDCEAR